MIKGFMTIAAVLTAGVAGATSASAATNLLVNGSFETGDFTGWTYVTNATDGQFPKVITYGQGGTPSYSSPGAYGEAVPADPLSNPFGISPGTHGAYFLSDRTPGDSISQTITLLANTQYTVGFDYYLPFNGYSNAGDASLTVTFAGQTVAMFDTSLNGVGTQPGQWKPITYTFTTGAVVPPTGTLSFNYNAAGTSTYGKDFVVDSLFVTASAELVPEPASWALMVAGFGLMGAALRRKRTSVAFA